MIYICKHDAKNKNIRILLIFKKNIFHAVYPHSEFSAHFPPLGRRRPSFLSITC